MTEVKLTYLVTKMQTVLVVEHKKKPAAHSVNCSLCNLTMHPKSLNRHLKKTHNTEFTPSCICVDESEGIYFVKKSMKGGIVY